MRDSKTPRFLAFLLLLSIFTPHAFASTGSAPLADEADDAGYEETARVVRVSMIQGDVSLRRAGSKNWERATLNIPLVEGDRLATGADARLEIQIDARNFIRVGEYATLDIVTLRDEGVALSLPVGTATLRLAGFNREREYFEIDAPRTTLAAEEKGLYRLDVSDNGNVRVTVRDGGRARLYSETSGFTLRDGRTAELVYQDSNAAEGDWDFSAARATDGWDSWVNERESYLASRLRYDRRDRYYDSGVWGAEELDAYGDWIETREYGYIWRPHPSFIGRYNNWAPYRYGSWRWCPPYGWTWVADEPWGWAPYHYGRWVYVNDYWCWAPRGYAYYGRRSWWRPALVVFVNIGGGYDHVGWYPLGYHHRDPQSNFYRRNVNRALEQRRVGNLNRVNPIDQRAVTTVPKRDFGKGIVRGLPATKELAARVVTGEPVRGKLDIRPVENDLTSGGGGGRAAANPYGRERKSNGLVIRNPSDPSITPVERKTGAAFRKPGLALDEELRRGRIYNNREPRKVEKTNEAIVGGGGGGGKVNVGDHGQRDPVNNGERGTGAVARPAPRVRSMPDRDGLPDMKREARPVDTGAEPAVRPRPEANGERKVKPVERPNDSIVPPPDVRRERPTPRPEVRDERAKPTQRERPVEDVYRPAPRQERKTERQERPAPPREERSAPREERRHDPPPQREERRSDPPPRADPPQRSEPPRSEPRVRTDDTPRSTPNKARPVDND